MFEVLRKYLLDKIELSDEELQLINSVSTIRKLRKQQYLLQEGAIWKYNAFVCSGCVRTYSVDNKGGEHIINFAVENWWTGDRESLLSEMPSRFNIDAIEDSVILLISKPNFEMLTSTIPRLSKLVSLILERSFIASQNRIYANISFTAEEKYKSFVEKYGEISLRIPQRMIASYLGITPETLSRVRKLMAKK
jgi:CRP-like cAMP-binding protein